MTTRGNTRTIDSEILSKFAAVSGGRYTAKQDSDGTWSIFDVPVFSELPAGSRRNSVDIGREWMEEAVKRSKILASEGYEAPLHIFHHDGLRETKPAGRIVFKDVRQIPYEGAPRWCVVTDFKKIPADVFAQIENEELPYRSVEVHDWEKPEIASVALLNDEVPFFKLAMLTIGTKVQYDAASIFHHAGNENFKAYMPASDKRGAVMLFRFGEDKKPDDKGGDEGNGDGKKPPFGKPAGDQQGAEGQPPNAQQGQPGQQGGVIQQPVQPAVDPMAEANKLYTAILGLLQTVVARQDQIGQRLGIELVNISPEPPGQGDRKPVEQPDPANRELKGPEAGGQQDGEPEGDEVNNDMDEPRNRTVKQMKENDMEPKKPADPAVIPMTKEQIEAFAAEAAEKAVLKRENERLQAAAKIDGLVAGAVESLKGWNVTDGLKASLRTIAEQNGEAGLKLFVDSFKTHTSKESPATFGRYEAAPGVHAMTGGGAAGLSAADEAVVQKFAAMGPKQGEKARRLAQSYQQIKSKITAPLEKFISANLDDPRA